MEQYWRSWLQKHSLGNKNISNNINNDMHNRKPPKDNVNNKRKTETNIETLQ